MIFCTILFIFIRVKIHHERNVKCTGHPLKYSNTTMIDTLLYWYKDYNDLATEGWEESKQIWLCVGGAISLRARWPVRKLI